MKVNRAHMLMNICSAMVLGGFALVSCNNETEIENIPETGQVTFSAQISNVKTRMVNNQWETGDQIGMKVDNDVKTYRITDVNGAMTTDDPNPFLWNKQAYTITAWWPMTSGAINLADQSDEQVYNKLDLLKSTAEVTSKEANLVFKHQMTRMEYNFQGAIGYTEEEQDAAKISFIGYGSVTFDNGELNALGNPDQTITPKKTDNRNGIALMMPCDMWDKPLIKVEIAGNTFIYTPRLSGDDAAKARGVLEAGCHQKYYLWVDKDKLQVKVAYSSSIEDFDYSNSDMGRIDLDAVQED